MNEETKETPVLTRVCKKCQIEKPLEDFHRHPTLKYGRQRTCKTCFSLHNKTYYAANKDKVKVKVVEFVPVHTVALPAIVPPTDTRETVTVAVALFAEQAPLVITAR